MIAGLRIRVKGNYDAHIAAYAYGPFGPISRTILNADAQHCVRYLLSDGRGNTIAVADDDDNFLYQGFDAFGVPLERAVISSCEMPECPNCKRARRASGELGYHGHEGYRTRHYDANREAELPNAQREDLTTPHPDYDPGHTEGYESPSTGFIQVGARDYDPYIGRFLEPDPEPLGPELQWGQNNRWAYCASDPVNASDPSGRFPWALLGLGLLIIGTGMQIASYFMAPGPGAAWTGAIGVLLAAVGGALLGHFGGLGPALSQLGTLINAAAPALFRVLAFFIAWIVAMLFGNALDSCTRSAIQGISTFQQFTNFVGKLFADASRASKERSTPEFTPIDAWRGLEVPQLSMRYT